MVMQKQNDQNVTNCACAKTQRKWDKLIIVAKQCPPLSKPILVKLTLKQLLQVLFNGWGVGSVPQDATSRMEKDENFQQMI